MSKAHLDFLPFISGLLELRRAASGHSPEPPHSDRAGHGVAAVSDSISTSMGRCRNPPVSRRSEMCCRSAGASRAQGLAVRTGIKILFGITGKVISGRCRPPLRAVRDRDMRVDPLLIHQSAKGLSGSVGGVGNELIRLLRRDNEGENSALRSAQTACQVPARIATSVPTATSLAWKKQNPRRTGACMRRGGDIIAGADRAPVAKLPEPAADTIWPSTTLAEPTNPRLR
jgi:hypothetical protein